MKRSYAAMREKIQYVSRWKTHGSCGRWDEIVEDFPITSRLTRPLHHRNQRWRRKRPGERRKRPGEDTRSGHWADPIYEEPEQGLLPLAAPCQRDKLFTQVCITSISMAHQWQSPAISSAIFSRINDFCFAFFPRVHSFNMIL